MRPENRPLADGTGPHVRIWAKRWLREKTPRLDSFGIIRVINDVWAIPGQIKLVDGRIKRVRLSLDHPQTHQALDGLRQLLTGGQPFSSALAKRVCGRCEMHVR
jgi:hypothetical protein